VRRGSIQLEVGARRTVTKFQKHFARDGLIAAHGGHEPADHAVPGIFRNLRFGRGYALVLQRTNGECGAVPLRGRQRMK
jgi:hypothetical protein